MDAKQAYPPNIDSIQAILRPSSTAIFTFGGTIYNPSGRELLPDIIHHEEVHQKQQGNNSDSWWLRYLGDPQFRLAQEIEAYGKQYAFACKHINAEADRAISEGKTLAISPTKLKKWALGSMAAALSGETYGNMCSYGEAESKIRNIASRINQL